MSFIFLYTNQKVVKIISRQYLTNLTLLSYDKSVLEVSGEKPLSKSTNLYFKKLSEISKKQDSIMVTSIRTGRIILS